MEQIRRVMRPTDVSFTFFIDSPGGFGSIGSEENSTVASWRWIRLRAIAD